MKRIILLLAICFMLASCAPKTEKDPFSAFDGALEVKIDAVIRELECSFSYSKADGALTFSAPGELEVVEIKETDGSYTFSYDGVSVSVSEYAAALVSACQKVFSAASEDMISITAKELDGRILTLVTTETAEYAFSSDGTLLSVTGSIEGTPFAFCVTEMRADG